MHKSPVVLIPVAFICLLGLLGPGDLSRLERLLFVAVLSGAWIGNLWLRR